MRIIAGKAKGRKLAPVKGRAIRPTLDRVREAVFNILGAQVVGARVLDLFAGTGAIGVEALSRGATHCTFVDSAPFALRLIRDNLEITGFQGNARVVQATMPKGLTALARSGTQFDIVFADPPYDFAEYEGLLEALARSQIIADDGLIVLELRGKTTAPERAGSLPLCRSERYGDTRVAFYS